MIDGIYPCTKLMLPIPNEVVRTAYRRAARPNAAAPITPIPVAIGAAPPLEDAVAAALLVIELADDVAELATLAAELAALLTEL